MFASANIAQFTLQTPSMRTCFPDCLSQRSTEEQREWAAQVAEHGTAFPEAPEHHAYRKILQNPTLNAMQRLDALLVELHRHWLLTDKESFS